jgi:hypothetical protein
LIAIQVEEPGGSRGGDTPGRGGDTRPPPPQRNTFRSPEEAVETFLGAVEAGTVEAIRGVWPAVTDAELQPWRTFLAGKRIQSASVRGALGLPTRTGREADFTPLEVSISYVDSANTAQSSVYLLEFRVFQDGPQWRIGLVRFLGADRQ